MYSEKFLIDLTKLLIDCHKTAVTIFDENKRIYNNNVMINDFFCSKFLYGYYCTMKSLVKSKRLLKYCVIPNHKIEENDTKMKIYWVFFHQT